MTPADVRFRDATPEDHTALAALLLECSRHYWGAGEDDAAKSEATARALLGKGGCRAVLAVSDDRALGFATITTLHPAPTAGGTLFMKDLFVSAEARGCGLGEKMMRWLAGRAASLGCSRFDWTAESDNPRAIAFYDEIGATTVAEKVYFRFEGADIQRFAGA